MNKLIQAYKDWKLKIMRAQRDAYSIQVQKYKLKFDAIDRKLKGMDNDKWVKNSVRSPNATTNTITW